VHSRICAGRRFWAVAASCQLAGLSPPKARKLAACGYAIRRRNYGFAPPFGATAARNWKTDLDADLSLVLSVVFLHQVVAEAQPTWMLAVNAVTLSGQGRKPRPNEDD